MGLQQAISESTVLSQDYQTTGKMQARQKPSTVRISKSNFDEAVAIKIALYFVLAFGISYLLNLLPTFLPLYGIQWVLNVGFGPFLAAILTSYLYRTPLKLRLFSETAWVRKLELVGLGIFLLVQSSTTVYQVKPIIL